METEASARTDCYHNTSHQEDFEKRQVLVKITNTREGLIREAIEVVKRS